MTNLRLLGSGSGNKNCPCLYATDVDTLIVQGTTTRDGRAVLVPHMLLDWAEPGMRITVEATGDPGVVLVAGEPANGEVLDQLILESYETAVEVPRCV